jgi:hypothetical protein
VIMADVRTNLRVPEELYEEIKRLAEKELRSINAQMVILLQAAVAQPRDEGRLRLISASELRSMSPEELRRLDAPARRQWAAEHPAPETLEEIEAARRRFDVAPILQHYGTWAVTEDGIECLVADYHVARDRIHEPDWVRHLSEKIWAVRDDIERAFKDARERWPQDK